MEKKECMGSGQMFHRNKSCEVETCEKKENTHTAFLRAPRELNSKKGERRKGERRKRETNNERRNKLCIF